MNRFRDFSERLRSVYQEVRNDFRQDLADPDISEKWYRQCIKYENTIVQFYSLGRIFTEDDAKRLQSMIYEEFTDSEYWHIVSRYVKVEKYDQCASCNEIDYNSELHHLSYDHHGWEHEYIDADLLLLCKSCHRKAHPQPINKHTLGTSRK